MKITNKVTLIRLILNILVFILCIFPFYEFGFSFPLINFNGVVIDLKFICAGILFFISSLLGFTFKSYKSKEFYDVICDKVFTNVLVIVFACNGFISLLLASFYILFSSLIQYLKEYGLLKGKLITSNTYYAICYYSLLLGIIMLFFYNIPFEFINVRVADFLFYFSTIMNFVILFDFYRASKKIS